MPDITDFRPGPVEIVNRLIERGFEAYIVGGAVRDILMGREPKDYDIATSATPEQVRQVFSYRNCQIIGRRFRLALVRCGTDICEVSTFRREPTPLERSVKEEDDGVMIWDDNQYGNLDDDVLRRDFTVNSLYCNVAGNCEIIDKMGGLQDMKDGIVRCIGDPFTRFHEDPVRMLRAVKLAGLYDFTLSDDVKAAINENVHLLDMVSRARLLDEVMKIMFTGHARKTFKYCHIFGLLKYILPTFEKLWTTPAGELIIEILRQRDKIIRNAEDYYVSKVFAMATLCIPLTMREADLENIKSTYYSSTCAVGMHRAVKEFFDGYMIPRSTCLIIRKLTVMAAALACNYNVEIIAADPAYPLAFELLRLLVKSSGWKPRSAGRLPHPDPEKIAELKTLSSLDTVCLFREKRRRRRIRRRRD